VAELKSENRIVGCKVEIEDKSPTLKRVDSARLCPNLTQRKEA
jgi:hypothetical protein